MKEVLPGSIWFGSGRDIFVVRRLVSDGGDIWVHYENVNTQQSYNCLIEAFTARFTANINHNYKF